MESIKEIRASAAGISKRARSLLVFSFITAISTGMAASVKAQTFAEWFSQKKTQKKYLLQQIAALQAFSGSLKQGYHIAANGMGSISGYLKDEHGLHTTYYSRLKIADPLVKDNTMVREIMERQRDILARLQELKRINGLTREEKSYLTKVSEAVLNDCDQQLKTLQTVISDNKIEMSDSERLSLLTKIHSSMMDNYRFASGFTTQAKMVVIRRQQEGQQATAVKQLYGIN
jgi:hypothetical protein